VGLVPVLLGAVAWLAPFLITAFVVLGWVDLLRPASQRTLVTSRSRGMVLALWSAWALLAWVLRLAGLPHSTARVLVHVHQVLFAAILVASVTVVRPRSGDFRRGRQSSRRGDLDGAAAAYRRVVGSGRRAEVPYAAFNLGCVLYRRGDLDGARAAFQRAIDSGRPDVVPRAILNLGNVLDRLGDEQGARAAYERVLGIPGARQAAKAALRLGEVLEREGDTEGARAAYRRAIDHGPREVREPAARALIQLNNAQAGE